jgi:hypothetical protein
MTSTLGTIMPSPWFQAFDDDGTVLAGALLDTYLAGTLTNEPTFMDSGLTVPNPNPVVCDGAGRATVFLSSKSYKFRLRRADGTTVRTADNIASVALGQSGAVGSIAWDFGGNPSASIVQVAYPSGATLDKTHPGSVPWNVDSNNLPGSYALEATLLAVAGITVTLAIVNLTDGSPDVPMQTISSVSATGERVRSAAIVFPAGGVAKDYAIKAKVSGGEGFAWGARIIRTA